MPEFTVEDLVGEAVSGKGEKILKDVQGEMRISAAEGTPKEVSVEIMGGEEAIFFINEEDRKEFGDRAVDVEVNFDGYETLEEKLPPKGLEEPRTRLPT